jgi:two-component system chemotaxis response regulator CheY
MSTLNKVLVVDDSALIRRMYRLIFMRYKDCTVVEAMNGLEALDVLSRDDAFDIIVLDINMPVMNGMQFMEKLKDSRQFRHIPVVVISTEGKEEDTVRAMQLGAWGYVKKPFKPDVLYDLIEKVLAKKPPVLTTGKYW